MSEDLGPRLKRRIALRRTRAIIVGSIMLVTAGGVAAVLLWPVRAQVPAPIVSRPLPAPRYLSAFGTAGSDPLSEPVGLAVAGGRVFVADASRGEVVAYSPDGTRAFAFGKGRLSTPLYIAASPLDGRLYVSDRKASGIYVFDLRGNYIRTFSPSATDAAAEGWKPLALAFSDSGTMYVTDAAVRQRILKVGPTGTLVADAGRFVPVGSGGAAVSYANGIAVGGDRVLVADSNNQRLLFFDPDLHYQDSARFDGLPRGACAVSWGADPVFAVANTTAGSVTLVDRDGGTLHTLGAAGSGDGRLSEPTGVAHDGKERLYVADSGNRRISVWRVVGFPRSAVATGQAPDMRRRIAGSIAVAGFVAAVAALLLCTRARQTL